MAPYALAASGLPRHASRRGSVGPCSPPNGRLSLVSGHSDSTREGFRVASWPSDGRGQEAAVDAKVRTGDESASPCGSEEDGRADDLVRLAEATHRRVGKDLATALRWATVVVEEQTAILLAREKPGVIEFTRTPFSNNSGARNRVRFRSAAFAAEYARTGDSG